MAKTAKDYRGDLQKAIESVYRSYGTDLGWTLDKNGKPYPDGLGRAVPPPVAEATMELESENNPDGVGVSPAGAIGPFQIVPTGQEASWYTEVTGFTPDLYDRSTNFFVGIMGLGKRMDQATNEYNLPDWFIAQNLYFGCIPNPDGSPDTNNPGDNFSNCVTYPAHLERYIDETYGPEMTAWLHSGNWVEANQDGLTGRAIGQDEIPHDIVTLPGGVIDDTKNAVTKAVQDVLQGLYNQIIGAAPRVGLAVAGLALVIIATKQVLS